MPPAWERPTPCWRGWEVSSQSEGERRQLRANLRLAEELGVRITRVHGDDPVIQIAEYVRLGGITKIVLGRSPVKGGLLRWFDTLMGRLGELAPGLNIYIIPDNALPSPAKRRRSAASTQERFTLANTAKALAILILCTAVGFGFREMGFKTANVIMVYILGVLGIFMATTGRSYSLTASLLSVLVFNFFFTSHCFTLMSAPSYIATFAVMFVVALLGSSLTARIKRQALQSATKAYRTEVLRDTSRQLQKAEDTQAILDVTATQLYKLLDRSLLLYLVGEDGILHEAKGFPHSNGSDLTGFLTPPEEGG